MAAESTTTIGSGSTSTIDTSVTEPEGLRRLTRWAKPFGRMTDADIEKVLQHEPFRSICPDPDRADDTLFVSFGVPVSIYGILKNDVRIRTFKRGEFVLRKGDYGNSAFALLNGDLRRIGQPELPPSMLGRQDARRRGYLGSLANHVRNLLLPTPPEYRDAASEERTSTAKAASLTDKQLNTVLDGKKYEALPMSAGVFFGEMGAIYRIPRGATIVAAADSTVLEVRWQGLRDLMQADDEFALRIDNVYRERSLDAAVESLDYLKAIPEDQRNQITFHSYGKFDEWSSEYLELSPEERWAVIEQEEVIALEGDYPNGVFIVRTGFARESVRYGHGHQTLNYLSSNQLFGLKEALHNWEHPNDPINLQHSLRAIGYSHVLHIPTRLMEEYVLPYMLKQDPKLPRYDPKNENAQESQIADTLREKVGPDLFEFFAEHRILNGRKTMLIDLHRCTRCDDCVRACAAAHDGNPRFVRHGPVNDNIMVANACMHCADPVCMIGCPTGAIHRESEEGRVVVNENTCIGCATCYSNCPYDAIRMVSIRDKNGYFAIAEAGDQAGAPIYKASKCDLCIDQPGGPACVRACPHDALTRVNMQDINELGRVLES